MPVEMGDLSHAYQEACHQVRSRIERFARGYWAQMPNYRDEAIADMVAAITPRVLAGQEAVAELTDAYLAACADLMGLAAPTGEVMASEIAAGLRGVDPYLVYERPGKEVYRRLSEGKDIDAAAKAGGLRLLNLIGTDIQLARTRQARCPRGVVTSFIGEPSRGARIVLYVRLLRLSITESIMSCQYTRAVIAGLNRSRQGWGLNR